MPAEAAPDIPDRSACRRPGCTFPRAYRKGRSPGRHVRRSATCSFACGAWLERAQRAVETEDAEEARRLVHFARLLDQRKDTQRAVPGIFDVPGKAA